MERQANVRLEDHMDHIVGQSLPHALNQLADRHSSFGQAVQYLEGKYIAAQRSGNSKDEIVQEAHGYIATGLANVFKDIELAASNLDQLMEVQELAVESLVAQVDMVQMRLQSTKNQHAHSTLDEMKVASGALTLTASPPAIRQVPIQRVSLPKNVPQSISAKGGHQQHLASSLYNFNVDSIGMSERQGAEGRVDEDSTLKGSTPQDSTSSSKKRRVSVRQRLTQLQSFGLDGK